jgi:menaquinone-dependent protoporphyrinogen oxidase
MNILLPYSTTDGHTIRICERIRDVLEEQDVQVSLVPVAEVDPTTLNQYDKVIIGASIRYGNHQQEVYDFIRNNQQQLDNMDNGFFSVCLVARKPNKNEPHTNPYYKKFLKRIGWQPKHQAVFAGKINYPIYRWQDRLMIQFIMWITKGPTDRTVVKEFTDWQKVDSFALSLKTTNH